MASDGETTAAKCPQCEAAPAEEAAPRPRLRAAQGGVLPRQAEVGSRCCLVSGFWWSEQRRWKGPLLGVARLLSSLGTCSSCVPAAARPRPPANKLSDNQTQL